MEQSTKTILLVDDDEGVRKLVSLVLRREGHEVLEAGNGVEALRLCRQLQQPIDLLVSDLIMPEMGGWELADTIRLMHPETKVLFVSGYVEEMLSGNGSNCAVLVKPFSAKLLAQRVGEVLSSRA